MVVTRRRKTGSKAPRSGAPAIDEFSLIASRRPGLGFATRIQLDAEVIVHIGGVETRYDNKTDEYVAVVKNQTWKSRSLVLLSKHAWRRWC